MAIITILAVTLLLSTCTHASDHARHLDDACDGIISRDWLIAFTTEDRGLLYPMRLHLGGSNVSIISFADGSHAPTHDLQLAPIRLVWRGSGQVCCDMRDMSFFTKHVQNWEIHMSLKLQLVDLSDGVAPFTPPLLISEGSFDVTHEFNDILSDGFNTSQQQAWSSSATPTTGTCSWSTSMNVSLLAPPLYNANGLSSVFHLKSGDLLRVLIKINEVRFIDFMTLEDTGGFKTGMSFPPLWIFIHNDPAQSPLYSTLTTSLPPLITLDDVHAIRRAPAGVPDDLQSSVFWIDLLHAYLSPRGCPLSPSLSHLRRAPSGQRICVSYSSTNRSTILDHHELAFISTMSRAHWHSVIDGAYGGHVHIFSCLSRSTTTQAMGINNGAQVLWHPWCLSPSTPFSHLSEPPLFHPLQSFHDGYRSLNSPLPATCETGLLVQRLRGRLNVEAAAAMICNKSSSSSGETRITSLHLLHIDAGMEGWCILADVAFAHVATRIHGPTVDQITAVLPMPCTPSLSSTSSSSCVVGACNFSAWTQYNEMHHPQWMVHAGMLAACGGKARSVMLALSMMEIIRHAFVVVVVDELHDGVIAITLMRKQLWAVSSVRESSPSPSASVSPSLLSNVDPSPPLPPCAQGPVCVCGFAHCSAFHSASSCLSPPLLRFVKTIFRICSLPRMQGKCSGLVHAPLTCSSVVKDDDQDNRDGRQHHLHGDLIRCTGESYEHVRGVAAGEAVLILEQNAALKRLVMYGIWHGQASVEKAAAAMDQCKIQNESASSSPSLSSEPSWSSDQKLTDNSSIVISSIRKGSGGLGNVFYSMIVGLVVAAYSAERRLYATRYSDEARNRYGGLFSAAVHDTFLDEHQHQHLQHQDQNSFHSSCPNYDPYGSPPVLDDDYWPNSMMKYAVASGDRISEDWIKAPIAHTIVCSPWSEYHVLNLVIAQPIAPAVTLLSPSSGAIIRDELGDTLVTFLSHFLITPAPGLRMEIESIVNEMRRSSATEPSPFIIGIHMRWAHESQTVFQRSFHAQYAARVGLSPLDFNAFVDAASVLAEGHPRVVFYIASDSLIRLLNLQQALSQPERGWSVVSANVLTNVSDGATADSIVDLFVLSMCDDLIASHTSTFSHMAAALGGHRPVLISAELSYKFGRQSIRRSRTLDWTMPTDSWTTFTPDLPYESWMSGGMSYGAQNHARACRGVSQEEAAAAVDVAASSFIELDSRQ